MFTLSRMEGSRKNDKLDLNKEASQIEIQGVWTI